jgi:hypothetical protein
MTLPTPAIVPFGGCAHALPIVDNRRSVTMHPFPQRRRPNWLDLGGPWGFAYDDAEVGLRDGWHEDPEPFQRVIQIPFPPESARSGIHDTTEHPVIWYRKCLATGATVACCCTLARSTTPPGYGSTAS